MPVASSVLGCVALALALFGPVHEAAHESLAAHMVQHILLIGVAAPLLAVSLARLRIPAAPAFAAHGAVFWLAHAPVVVAAMAASGVVHVLAHAALFGTALAFWCAIARGSAGEASLWVLATMIHTGVLGALLTVAPRPLYPGIALEDQQLAGLLMWVPGGFLYLAAGLAYAWRSYSGHAVRA
jgi:putative membrane protein